MGKMVLIVIILMVIMLSTIFISLRNRSDISYDDIALRNTQNESKLLSNYAMQYGIKILNDPTQSPNKSDIDAAPVYKKVFTTPFAVKNGVIDSLTYAYDDSSNVILNAYVTYTSNNNTVSSIARAILEVPPPNTVTLGNIDNAISSKGPIELAGKATSSKGVHGDVLSENEILYQNKTSFIDGNEVIDTFPTFEEIFGITIEEMREIANYVGLNPNPLDGINFLSGQSSYIVNNSLAAAGSGILIIEGDLKINGDLYFEGVIWVTGKITGLGNSHIFGALFAAGVDLSQTGGSFLLEFDENLSGSTFTGGGGNGYYRILAIYEDIRN
ncbi:MAG: hypothetical protein APR54_04975 [Candidatus Cloacimonas sp. SDB]|nr:MAG: hypothetical protein APR54_04975 [Candidatus Cloacimonas sp. SDB]